MKHVSTLELHQLHLDELPTSRGEQVRAHLAACARCTERYEAVRSEADAFDDALPAALQGLVDPPEPVATPAHWAIWLRRLAPAAAALAAAAVALFALPMLRADPASELTTRTRGELPQLEVWVAAPEGPRPLREGEALAAGDRVQLLYNARGAERVGLAGRDGTGEVEVYGVLTPPSPGLHPAPFGLALDDAPGPQVFFAVPGGPDLQADAVERTVREVPLPHGVQVVTVPKREGRR